MFDKMKEGQDKLNETLEEIHKTLLLSDSL